jgi:hypothetical protein
MENIKLTPLQEKNFLNLVFSDSLKAGSEAIQDGEDLFQASIQEIEKANNVTAQRNSFREFCNDFSKMDIAYFEQVSIVDFFENTLLEMQEDTSDPMRAISASQQYNHFQELKKKFIQSEQINNIKDF